MGSRLRSLGIVGATIILVGTSLVGSGFALTGLALSSVTSCGSHCEAVDRNADNETVLGESLEMFGLAVGAAGAAVLLAASVQFMDRWPSVGTRAPGEGPGPPAGPGRIPP